MTPGTADAAEGPVGATVRMLKSEEAATVKAVADLDCP